MRNISAGIGGQVGHLMVNGPAGDALCWDAIDWRFHEDNVRRLRQRIFTAARDGDLGKLRNLQPVPSLGLLELLAVKAARAVLRGPRRSNAPGLPDCSISAARIDTAPPKSCATTWGRSSSQYSISAAKAAVWAPKWTGSSGRFDERPYPGMSQTWTVKVSLSASA